MKKLRSASLSPQAAESLRLAGVQGFFWAAMAVGNYLSVYLQNNGFPAARFGLLNAIACAVSILAMTFWGVISDRTGSVRKIVILTLTLGCGLYALVPLIPADLPVSPVLFLIFIPAISFFRTPMAPFVDNLTVRNCAEHGLNYGAIRSSGSFLFAIAGVLVVNLLIPGLGLRSTFWAMGLVMLVAIVLTWFCYEPQGGGKRAKKTTAGSGELFRNPKFVTFLIFCFVFQMGMTFESGFLPYLMADLDIDSTNLGLILSVRALMEIPFLFFIAKLRRRIKLHHLIMMGAALMGLEALLFSFFVHSLPQMLVFAAFYGLGGGLWIGTSTNYIYELAPAHLRATAHGLFISVSQISGILSNLLGGVLFDLIGGKPFYCVVSCVFALSIVIFALSFSMKGKNKAAASETN